MDPENVSGGTSGQKSAKPSRHGNLLPKGACSPHRLKHVFQPVPHIGDTDHGVVFLTVMVPAFVTGKDLEDLLPGADCVEAALSVGQRNLCVPLAMDEQE